MLMNRWSADPVSASSCAVTLPMLSSSEGSSSGATGTIVAAGSTGTKRSATAGVTANPILSRPAMTAAVLRVRDLAA